MDKQEQLEIAIYNSRGQNIDKQLRFILMHPETWDEIKKEILYAFKDASSKIQNEITGAEKYRGADVMRTLDLDKGDFRMGY